MIVGVGIERDLKEGSQTINFGRYAWFKAFAELDVVFMNVRNAHNIQERGTLKVELGV